jgi:MFS family permease
VIWLFLARALMGVGVGLTAGPSTASVVEFATGNASGCAALITTVAQAGGFAAVLLLGGALVQYAPWPTRLSFWVLAALLALLFAAARFYRGSQSCPARQAWWDGRFPPGSR